MSKLMTLAAMFVVAYTLTMTAQAQANPVEAAQRCVTHVNRVADRAEAVIADDTAACLQEIRRLLCAGRVEAAHAVARRCHQDAKEVVRRAAAEIDTVCTNCIRYLDSVGAFRLARRVDNHCGLVLDGLDALLDRQQQALADALN